MGLQILVTKCKCAHLNTLVQITIAGPGKVQLADLAKGELLLRGKSNRSRRQKEPTKDSKKFRSDLPWEKSRHLNGKPRLGYTKGGFACRGCNNIVGDTSNLPPFFRPSSDFCRRRKKGAFVKHGLRRTLADVFPVSFSSHFSAA